MSISVFQRLKNSPLFTYNSYKFYSDQYEVGSFVYFACYGIGDPNNMTIFKDNIPIDLSDETRYKFTAQEGN